MLPKRSFREVLSIHPVTLTKCVTFSGFVLLKFRLELYNTNDCKIRYMITESS